MRRASITRLQFAMRSVLAAASLWSTAVGGMSIGMCLAPTAPLSRVRNLTGAQCKSSSP